MKFVNLTNKQITLVDDNGKERFTIKPSGAVVAASVNTVVLDKYKTEDGHLVEIVNYEFESVTLPDPKPDTIYVVSYAVLQATGGKRPDVVAPDTSPGSVIRAEGSQRILGVKRLRQL